VPLTVRLSDVDLSQVSGVGSKSSLADAGVVLL
jgi:hypothetical protein